MRKAGARAMVCVATLLTAVSAPAGAGQVSREKPYEAGERAQGVPAITAEQWNAISPGFAATLERAGLFGPDPAERSVALISSAVLGGDGVPVALLGLGAMGASTDARAIARIENGQPVLPTFRLANGRLTQDPGLLDGASVTHTDVVALAPDRHAVYHLAVTSGPHCSARAFVWDARDKVFAENEGVARRIARERCRAVEAQAGYLPKLQ